jgi:predicted SprT family Zn-dependent metalloprotease
MITKTQFVQLDGLFDYYNNQLFEGKLADCMINMSRKKGAHGFFSPENWKDANKQEGGGIHEININPDGMDRKEIDWHSTVVHEMVHLWQNDFGEPSRNGYHNKQWADKMLEIGLIPTDTGKPGGKKTGQRMTHYIADNGAFIKAFNALKEKKIKYIPQKFLDTGKKSSGKSVAANKTKYTCPCGNNVWGKPDLTIICGVCNELFEQEEN